MTLLGRGKIHPNPTTERLGLTVPSKDHSGYLSPTHLYRQTSGSTRAWSPVPTSAELIAYGLGKPSSSRVLEGLGTLKICSCRMALAQSHGSTTTQMNKGPAPTPSGPLPRRPPNPRPRRPPMPDALLQPRPTSLWGPWFAALRPPRRLTCSRFHQS